MTHAVISEWDRVVAWHNRRHDFSEGRYYSWLEAMWTVAENSPGMDKLWDELVGIEDLSSATLQETYVNLRKT
jgi:hypothetical protein